MKKLKAKAKPAKTPTAKSVAVKQPPGLPTPVELAMIAATLAGSTITDNPRGLAESALKLVLAAQNELKIHVICDRLNSQAQKDNAIFAWGAQEFPLTRDNFLKMVLPTYKSRTADLAQKAKAFLRDSLRRQNQKEPTKEEIDAAHSHWPAYKTPNEANRAAFDFKEWYRKEYIRKSRHDAGLKSAQAKKKVQETPLT